jgi:hypothetical protein
MENYVCVGVGVALYIFNSGLDGGEWSRLHPGRFNQRCPLNRRLEPGRVWMLWRVEQTSFLCR